MDYSSALEVFKAQTKNVHTLKKAIKQIKRTINHDLRAGDATSTFVHTKILCLTFSSWAEARFSQLIHTPYCFTPDEISQIKLSIRTSGIEKGWEKCLDLALRRVSGSKKGNDIPNKRQKILKIIKTYIIEPSLIRNKIAHGQWTIALNSDNNAANQELTKKLDELDVITVSIWIEAYEYVARIIEGLIESPNRAFQRDYWLHLTELETFLNKAQSWSLADKIQRLRSKPLR